MDLHGNRHDEQYIFKKVQWSNYQEHGKYDHILSGSIEQAVDSELKIMGSFDFEGYEIPDVNDLVRVYYSCKDDSGEEFKEPLATFIVGYAKIKYEDTLDGLKASGTLNGQSMLSVLKNVKSGAPFTVKRNMNAIYVAQQICRLVGLQVNAELSSFTLSADHTFEAGATYLEIVNWLLESALYLPAFPDENGIIQFVSLNTYNSLRFNENRLFPENTLYPQDSLFPSGDDNLRGYYFANDERSIMLPEIDVSNDWQTTPNVVRLLYNLDDACIVSYAKNMSGSRASLDQRGNREITHWEEISELGTGDKRQRMLDIAVEKLNSISADIEIVEFKHVYVPIRIYDPIVIKYSDMKWVGNVDNMTIDLSPSTECQTKIKRVLDQTVQISSGAEVLRQ